MQTEALRNLVAKIKHLQCEMQTVELKATNKGCPTRLYDTLSSFANQDEGGVIVFGIDERKGFEVVGVYVQLLERIRRYHAERDIRCPAEREACQAPARRVNKPVEAAAQELAQKQRNKQQTQRIVDKIHLRCSQKVGLCRHQQAQRDREHRHVEH